MSRARIAGVIVAAVVVAAAVAWRMRQTGAEPQASTRPDRVAPAELPTPRASAQPAGPASQPQQPDSHQDAASLEQRFQDADDLLAFVESIRDAAKAGDGDSSWWIYRAIMRCDGEYLLHFRRRGRIVTLDEALQFNAGNPFVPMDETRKLHAQCGRMREMNFAGLRPARDWLTPAAYAGIPQAGMALASAMLSDSRKTGTPDPGQRTRAQEWALLALRSREPEVMLSMAGVAPWLARSIPSGTEMDWVIAACQRGLDCGSGSQLVANLCRSDPGCQPFEDVEAVLRRNYGEEYDDFARRAREINQFIDQDRFDDLGAWIAARQ